MTTAVLVTVDYVFSHLLPKVPDQIDPKAGKKDLRRKDCLVPKNGQSFWSSFRVKKDNARTTYPLVREFVKNKKNVWTCRGTGALTCFKISKLKEFTKSKEHKYPKCFLQTLTAVVKSILDVCENGVLNVTYSEEPVSTLNPDSQEGMHLDACFVRGPVDSDRDGRTSWVNNACVGTQEAQDGQAGCKGGELILVYYRKFLAHCYLILESQ